MSNYSKIGLIKRHNEFRPSNSERGLEPIPIKVKGIPKDKSFSNIKYLVRPIAQPNWDACLPTAILMIVRWKDLMNGIGFYHSELEDEVLASKKIAEESSHLRTLADLTSFSFRYNLLLSKIKIEPNSFQNELATKGPFGYIAKAQNRNYQHTLVITGITKLKDFYYLHYNNPDGGQSGYLEFYEFILKLLPDFTNEMATALIISPYQNSRR